MFTTRNAYMEHLPCPPLRRLVRCYWTLLGPVAEEQRVVRILPDGCMDLIFDLRGGMLPTHIPETDTPPSAFLSGIMHEHELIRLPKDPMVVGIRLLPGGASILPAPATEFACMNVPIEDILPKLAPMAHFLAETAPSHVQLAAVVETHLLDRLCPVQPNNNTQLEAARRLSHPLSNHSIAHLASCLGVSQKTLERSFKKTIGLTPKKFARVNRLIHSVRLLARQPIAHTALDAGYADQAHFTKDFKQFCGLTPAQFLATPDTVDFLQDALHIDA